MRAHTAIILASLLAAAPPCLAQSAQWSGPKTIGDINRENFVAGVLAARDARRATGQLSSEIARARREFFATRDDPKRRVAAEREFAEALRVKDMTYFGMMVPMGVKAVEMTQVLGGSIDGGIAEPLRPSFFAQVNDVRTTLGARTPDQALFLNDEQAFRRAFEASLPAYERYKTLRDRREIEAWERREADPTVQASRAAVAAATSKDGGAKLASETAAFFKPYHYVMATERTFPQLFAIAERIRLSGQPVLGCKYGPKGVSSINGLPDYEYYSFWHRKPPAEIDALIAAHGSNLLKPGIRTRKALESCPPTETSAQAFAR